MNATHLFEKIKHSEHYWSSLFAVLVRYLSSMNKESGPEIPLWNYVDDGREWEFQPAGQHLMYKGLGFEDVLVEADVGLRVRGKKCIADVTLRPHSASPILIENKTIGSNVGAQLDNYYEAIKESGKRYQLHVLVSSGWENEELWKQLAKSTTERPTCILWENIFKILSRPDLPFSRLLDFSPYCQPTLKGSRR